MDKELKNISSEIPVVILAGGAGINLGLNGQVIPKSMVEINGIPLLLYIMDHYGKSGFNKFIICAGYRIEMIKDLFDNKKLLDEKFNINSIDRTVWDITVVDTGKDAKTGSRVAQIESLVNYSPIFCLTYGDTVSDVNLLDMLSFHLNHKRIATILAVHAPTRFRILGLYAEENIVRGFAEEPILQHDYINGGFYFFNNSIFELGTLKTDFNCTLETDTLEDLVSKKELYAFKHKGFWQYLDNERDRQKISLMLK